MCANVGVDPLSSNKGMWTQLLGFGDFYYELGVQVGQGRMACYPGRWVGAVSRLPCQLASSKCSAGGIETGAQIVKAPLCLQGLHRTSNA